MSDTEPSCSFCHRLKSRVGRLIASDGGAYICNYCVAVCYEVLVKEGVDVALQTKPHGEAPKRQDE